GKRDEAEAAYRQAWLLDPSSADAARELAPFGWTKERLVTAASHSIAAPAIAAPAIGAPAIAAPAPEVASAETTVNGPVSRSAGRRAREGLITRADRAQSAGQWRLAARLYRKALDRNPDNPPIWVQYGHALKESGDAAEAERAYRAALSYAPGVADTHLQLGHVLKLQGKTEEAQAAYLRAFALENRQRDSLDELAGLGWASMQLSELTQ